MVGKTTPDRGALGKPPIEWTPTSGEQERHNVTVITVGSKYEVYVRSLAPSHMQTLNNPFEPCSKVRGIYVVKEVFMRPSFLRPLFMRLSLMLCRCDAE